LTVHAVTLQSRYLFYKPANSGVTGGGKGASHPSGKLNAKTGPKNICSIYHRTNLSTTVCRRKSRSKPHLFKTFYQLHEAGKTFSCLNRKTGFLDSKNAITDNTGCPAYLNWF